MKAEVLEAVAEDIKCLSEKDVQDILDIFNFADLDAVYIHLGLEKRDIDHAKLAEPHRPIEQARKLLNLWRNRKSAAATRGAMMRAMMRCPDCKRAMDELKKKWELCTDDSTQQVLIMENKREAVHKILTKLNPSLRDHLYLDEAFCVMLRATDPEVLSKDDHQKIKALQIDSEKIDLLLKIMKGKPMDIYLSFMNVLQQKDQDLYKEVKAVQDVYLPAQATCIVEKPQAGNSLVSASYLPQTRSIGRVLFLCPLWPHLLISLSLSFVCVFVLKIAWGSNKSPERPLATGLWKQTGQFSTKPSILGPWGIAIHQDGDVAVTNLHKANVFSKDGHMKHSFKGPFEEHLTDIAITTDNRYILPSQNKIRFYDRYGNPLNYCNIHNVANKRTFARGLTVDLSGMIIAGLNDNTISIHHEDGSFKHKFATTATPHSLDVTSKGHIAVTFLDDTLQLMDYSGKIVRDVQRPQGINLWKPSSLCCSKQGDIFIVNLCDKAIYECTADGECLGCIISGLNDPRGIAITADGQQLYVVEYRQDMVKIFQRSDL